MPRSRLPLAFPLPAVLGLAIGLVATLALFLGLRYLEHDRAELEFRQRANVRILTMQQQLEETVQTLKVLNQLFVTVEPISREQFRVFTQPLVLRHPYIQAFNFHRYLPDSERAAYEAQMRKDHPDYSLRQLKQGRLVPAEPRERHLVIDYIEPMAGNEITFGLDVSTVVQLDEAVRKAVDTGQVTSTSLLTLAQGEGKRRGFIVIMPVYRHGISLDSVDARRAAVIGDTAAVFDAVALFNKILLKTGLNDPEMAISVYADGVRDERHLVFKTGYVSHASLSPSWLPPWILHDHTGSLVYKFAVADRHWHVVVSAVPAFFTIRNNGSLFVLIGGVLFSVLLAAYVQTLSSRTRRIRMLVDQRTAELRAANERLVEDIAARKRVEHALRLRQRAIEASANAVILTSAKAPHYPIEYVNPAFERITGYTAAEVEGRSCSLLWAHDSNQPEIRQIFRAVREERDTQVILRNYRKDGTMFWCEGFIAPVRDETGAVNHFVVAMYDITATKRYQADLEFQANRDTLTGLANRNLLYKRLHEAATHAERHGHPVWVLFLNLDRFKFVNDTLGHRAGDQLLQIVAGRLQHAVRDTDTIARLSADEFVLVLRDSADGSLSPATVQRVMDAIAQPIVIEGYQFVMGCSAGIAACPEDGREPDTLIKHAGIAMYRAKEMGRNNYQFYTSAMNQHAMERLRIEGDLRGALERGEFLLHYQPQVDVRSGKVLGVEALIRWQHPELGLVPPARFISLAEEMGLIAPIGAWVLRTACRQVAEWRRVGRGDIRVAVNLSARQFYQQDLVASIENVLAETGLAPHLLELELTESMMMTDVEHAAGILHNLKKVGVHLSIDDFGTGYSSLSYLKRFPIDLLKIDRSFVRDITTDPDDAAIVLSIISLAHSLRLEVIAEGVETESQLAFLKEHGCDFMQGYYFSRPLPAEECERLL